MRVEHVYISGFRSIQEVNLTDCGGFNVIIGKNNSGKSNLLLALNAFFSCLRGGQPLHLDPPVGNSVDRFGGQRDTSINIGVVFRLSLAERDNLLQEIVSESPQVKNAADGMNPELRLGILLSIPAGPDHYAYVKKIALCRDPRAVFTMGGDARTILQIGDQAARELVARAKIVRQRERDSNSMREYADQAVRYLDDDDWARIKSEPSPTVVRALRFSQQGLLRGGIQSKVEELLKAAESKSAFREAIAAYSGSLLQEAQEARNVPLKNRIESFSGEEESVPQYALSLLKLAGDLKLKYLTERREPIGKKEAAQLLELKVKRGGPEKLRLIQETVASLLGVEIDAFQAESRPGGEAVAELDVDRFLVEVNGAGIREALRLVLDFEFGKPDILLVEEPEIHLHPALETSMMRYLKRAGEDGQIFVTTHSTNFLDTAEMRNVYLASKNGSTKVQLINLEEAQESIPRELGIRLSSLFMFDKLIFVEGPTDEDVMREWASILRINLGNSNVGFVPMGGVRNLSHFAAEGTIGFLTRRQVKLWFVIDRDERDDSEAAKLIQVLGDKARVKILAKRELENYLAITRPLVEFISMKRQLANLKEDAVIVSEAAVSAALNASAESLKEVAIERRVAHAMCQPNYSDRNLVLSGDGSIMQRVAADLENRHKRLSDLKHSIESVYREQSLNVEEQWSTQKLDIVPGDLLLDKTCRAFGVRFHKERDSGRLAALMNADEIGPDLASMLRELVSR